MHGIGHPCARHRGVCNVFWWLTELCSTRVKHTGVNHMKLVLPLITFGDHEVCGCIEPWSIGPSPALPEISLPRFRSLVHTTTIAAHAPHRVTWQQQHQPQGETQMSTTTTALSKVRGLRSSPSASSSVQQPLSAQQPRPKRFNLRDGAREAISEMRQMAEAKQVSCVRVVGCSRHTHPQARQDISDLYISLNLDDHPLQMSLTCASQASPRPLFFVPWNRCRCAFPRR